MLHQSCRKSVLSPPFIHSSMHSTCSLFKVMHYVGIKPGDGQTVLFKWMKTNCPAQGFYLQAAVLSVLLSGCAQPTFWAQFTLPICSSTQHRQELSRLLLFTLTLCCIFLADADSFAGAETRLYFALIPGEESQKQQGKKKPGLARQEQPSSLTSKRNSCH